MKLEEVKKELLKDPKFKEEYYKPDHLGMEFCVLRNRAGLTQEKLADKIGTKQECIARFESGDYMPSLRWLHKVTRAIGYYLKIDFKIDT